MENSSKPIGVFDSGLGGLTILKALQEFLPNEQFIYYGDTAHLPYGEKSESALKTYVSDISSFLKARECKLMVVACNSASTVVSEDLKLAFDHKDLITVIQPVVERVAKQKRFHKIGIIGTRKTIDSHLFEQSISSLNPQLELRSKKTPLLVPMIEEGFIDQEVLNPIFERYFNEFDDLDLIIPACTHYPIIYQQIENYFNQNVKVLHTPKIIAEEVRLLLEDRGWMNSDSNKGADEYHLSDLTDSFKKEAEMFLGKVITLQQTLLNSK